MVVTKRKKCTKGSAHHNPCAQEVQVGGLGTMYSQIYIIISRHHLKAKETNKQEKDSKGRDYFS